MEASWPRLGRTASSRASPEAVQWGWREGGGAHLQVGELLLLVCDGLLHQHTLDALLHGILLGLRETAVRSTGGARLQGDGVPPVTQLGSHTQGPGGMCSPSGGPPAAQASGEAAPAWRLCSVHSPS